MGDWRATDASSPTACPYGRGRSTARRAQGYERRESEAQIGDGPAERSRHGHDDPNRRAPRSSTTRHQSQHRPHRTDDIGVIAVGRQVGRDNLAAITERVWGRNILNRHLFLLLTHEHNDKSPPHETKERKIDLVNFPNSRYTTQQLGVLSFSKARWDGI